MSDQSSSGPRFPRFEARTRRAVAHRRVFPFLVLATAALGVLAGFLATLLAPKDFPTFGTGIWWAIVTLGTVGYGDVVPHTAWGRVLGSALIIVGVTFLAFLIAIVTSYFVASDDEEKRRDEREQRELEGVEVMDALRRIEVRLDAIEIRLGKLNDG